MSVLCGHHASAPAWNRGVQTVATPAAPLHLARGGRLDHAALAYETFGPWDADEVVLVAHALTGDAHAATGRSDRPGWWDAYVGPERAIDTNRVLVVCSNVLGGCAGSTGPASRRGGGSAHTTERWGREFPFVTISDMVTTQARLLDAIGIRRPVSVIGGSIGGFQALEWALRFPERVRRVGVIASGRSLDAQGLALNAIARRALRFGEPGFAVARAIGHVSYRSRGSLQSRFGRRRIEDDSASATIALAADRAFEVERYLMYKGDQFARRFDADALLGLTLAMDDYQAGEAQGGLEAAFRASRGPLLAVGFDSDTLFPPQQTMELADTARSAGVRTRASVLRSPDGHDAFLLPHDGLDAEIRDWLETPA